MSDSHATLIDAQAVFGNGGAGQGLLLYFC
jgi:hypothetical protein